MFKTRLNNIRGVDGKIKNNKGKVNLIVVYEYGIGREIDKKEHSIGITLIELTLVEKSTNIWSSIAIVETGTNRTGVDGLV